MSSSPSQHREELEAKIAKLHNTRTYWLRWEVDHEACKEEMEELGQHATANDMLEIGKAYKGNILNETDIKVMINYGRHPTKTRDQVIATLSNRAESMCSPPRVTAMTNGIQLAAEMPR
jgi:unconventional prefoldin RPB5 interactor 1